MDRFLNKNKKGVTLIEVLIVLVIISILIILIIAYFRNQIFKGNDARRKADIHKIQVAIEEYEKDNNCYPLPQLLECQPGSGLLPYLDKVPCDPTTGFPYYYEYDNSGCPKWYRLYADLDNLADQDLIPGVGPDGSYNYYAESPNAPGGVYNDPSGFYGCRNLTCVSIEWDPTLPGPECGPNFQSPTCYGFCSDPAYDCKDRR
jgi:prepilin-type N-terminal cleavage/methylation domain-containing protein